MITQSPGSLNRDNFGTPPWEFWNKKPFGCGCCGKAQSIPYGGRWWLPRVQAMVTQVSPELPKACPNTKGVPESELTDLLVGLMQVRVNE